MKTTITLIIQREKKFCVYEYNMNYIYIKKSSLQFSALVLCFCNAFRMLFSPVLLMVARPSLTVWSICCSKTCIYLSAFMSPPPSVPFHRYRCIPTLHPIPSEMRAFELSSDTKPDGPSLDTKGERESRDIRGFQKEYHIFIDSLCLSPI